MVCGHAVPSRQSREQSQFRSIVIIDRQYEIIYKIAGAQSKMPHSASVTQAPSAALSPPCFDGKVGNVIWR